MAGVVALVAPNGLRVSVAADKESAFVANGYKPVKASAPSKEAAPKRAGSSKK